MQLNDSMSAEPELRAAPILPDIQEVSESSFSERSSVEKEEQTSEDSLPDFSSYEEEQLEKESVERAGNQMNKEDPFNKGV